MQERSGWGLKSEDNEPSINDRLEQKCTFFWRLEEIWGSRPNATVVVHTESITISPNVPPQRVSQEVSQATSQAISQAMLSQPASYESQAGSRFDEEDLFDWSASPTPQPPQHTSITPQPSQRISNTPQPPQRTKKYHINLEKPQHIEKLQHTEKRKINTLRPIIEDKENARQKRHKSEMDVQLEIAKMQ